MKKRLALAALLALGFMTGARAQSGPADLVIVNARVFTSDPSGLRAEALAIKGDRIAAVGSAASMASLKGPSTRVIDAGGRSVVPGFNDAHVHLLRAGQRLGFLNLKEVSSQQEFARRIGERAQKTPAGQWILGGEWDDQRWTPAALPTAALIDAVAPNVPVFLHRYDGHMAVANSLALKLAGVTAATPDPPGGAIVRDAKGQPTGVFKDGAMPLVQKVVPTLNAAQRRRALEDALAYMASFGVTSVQDVMTEWDTVELYEAMGREGALTARIFSLPVVKDFLKWKEEGRRFPPDTPYLHTDGVKAIVDGSLGSTTAYFFEPFSDAPDTAGLLTEEMLPLAGMRDRLTRADRAGAQIAFHAIGDRANAIALDLFEEIARANPPRDHRFRIEHAQHLRPVDIPRFGKIPVIASVQPYHAIDDGRFAERRLGPVRIQTTYAFRSLAKAGARLALGTDWFHAPLNPMETLYAAVTRATLDGKNPGGWIPAEKLSLEDAIEGYTLGSAYAEFRDKDKGSITVGKYADIVLLSADVFAIRPEALRDVKVDMTLVGGRVVYERSAR